MASGAQFLAEFLRRFGVGHVYGLVGVPITPVAQALVEGGVPFLGFRNEQAASYAASVDAYLDEKHRPGVLLTVSGPGFIHALPGLVSAHENGWPLLAIVATVSENIGTCTAQFQEYNHSKLLVGWAKFDMFSKGTIGCVEKLQRLLIHTMPAKDKTPGVSVLQISAAWISDTIVEPLPKGPLQDPKIFVDLQNFDAAVEWIRASERPLIVLGKGAAYGRLDEVAAGLIDATRIPFLPMPMAKGLIPDSHELCFSAARSLALQRTDLLILVGARSNWMLPVHEMLHKNATLRVIRFDLRRKDCMLENSKARVLTVAGDCRDSIAMLLSSNVAEKAQRGSWTAELAKKREENHAKVCELIDYHASPLGYHTVYDVLARHLERSGDTLLITEGSNTMDIARVMLPSYKPRHRLDAGSFSAMGVGMPYAIAAAVANPRSLIVYVAGDSAFGFSIAEVETAVRYRLLNIVVIVMNNSGIYSGIEPGEYQRLVDTRSTEPPPALLPPTALTPGIRYDRLSLLFPEAVQGEHVETVDQLHTALGSKSADKMLLINVRIGSLLAGPLSSRANKT